MTVGELNRRMDASEFGEWLDREEDDPLPDPWWMAGMICATVANFSGNSRKKLQPWDFFPWLRPEPRVQSAAEGMARLRSIAGRMGGG
jgi:hypothetical protein